MAGRLRAVWQNLMAGFWLVPGAVAAVSAASAFLFVEIDRAAGEEGIGIGFDGDAGGEAVHKLITGEQPETSWIGIALVATSVIGMPFLAIAKRRLAHQLGSVATRGRGDAEPPLRLSRRRRPHRPAGEHPLWALVARPRRSARHRGGGDQGRPGKLAGRRLLLRQQPSRRPLADASGRRRPRT